ncbi:MAG TPA: hypothetical protein PLP73_00035 [Candidatus Absconditabacterales bacterium]|nr:hypothetical protein [Candidatus Absconditabacterales bacterium]
MIENTELFDILKGGITAEKPYYEQTPPYAYIESISLPQNNIFMRYVISVYIILGADGTDKEFRNIITLFDNLLLPPIDGCLNIKEVGDVKILDITKGYADVKTRYSSKGNLILRQDYYFDTSIVK